MNSTNRVYIVLIAYADNPTYSLSYQLVKKEELIANETNNTDSTVVNNTNITTNETQTQE